MKKKILSLLAAFFMLFGTSAMAQVDSTLEGDVNGDGVVDIADITAVIAIIKQNAEANPTYYWYVGITDPSTMTSISPIVTNTTSPGWRLIGNNKPTSSTFTSSNMLWNGDTNNIAFGSRAISYIAIPYKPLQMWDVTGGDGLFYTIQNNGNPTNIGGVDYYIYMSDYKTAAFTMNIYNK